MISNKTKKTVQLLVMAILPAMSPVAEADQPIMLFDYNQPAQGAQGGEAVSPSYTKPIVDYVGSAWESYITGLRVAGTLDWVKQISTSKLSAPNLAGLKTLTLTCSVEFHNPFTSALIYQTPILSQVSGLFNGFWTMSGCAFAPINQAGNPRGLLIETVSIQTNEPILKIRVMDVATRTIKWTAVIFTTVALGSPSNGYVVDVNGDGTAELVLQYYKDVTPVGFAGSKTQRTRQVRNGLTGSVMTQASWIETYTN